MKIQLLHCIRNIKYYLPNIFLQELLLYTIYFSKIAIQISLPFLVCQSSILFCRMSIGCHHHSWTCSKTQLWNLSLLVSFHTGTSVILVGLMGDKRSIMSSNYPISFKGRGPCCHPYRILFVSSVVPGTCQSLRASSDASS